MTTKQLPSAARATLTLIGDYERAAERCRELAGSITIASVTYSYDPDEIPDRNRRVAQHRAAADEYQAEADRLRTYLPKDPS